MEQTCNAEFLYCAAFRLFHFGQCAEHTEAHCLHFKDFLSSNRVNWSSNDVTQAHGAYDSGCGLIKLTDVSILVNHNPVKLTV